MESFLNNKVEILANNTNVRHGGEVPFMVLFYAPPEDVAEFGVKIVDVKDVPEAEKIAGPRSTLFPDVYIPVAAREGDNRDILRSGFFCRARYGFFDSCQAQHAPGVFVHDLVADIRAQLKVRIGVQRLGQLPQSGWRWRTGPCR